MLGSTMAMPGNETHRFPVQGQPRSPLASARPLKSSPLAGPAVIVSLIDGTLSSTPAPVRPRYLHTQQHDDDDLPARPKSVHHALAHRSRSISAQSPSRPVSLYAYCPPGPGVAIGIGEGNSSSGYGSAHGSTSTSSNTQHPGSGGSSSNANANANANVNNVRRKRPSTAPGPSSKSSFDWIPNAKDEERKEEQQQKEEEIEEMDISESYSSYTDVHPVSTSAQAQAQPQPQDQTLHCADDTNADNRVMRYSPDATSPAGPVGGGGVGINPLAGPTTGGGMSTATSNANPRPPSILLTESQSMLQPKPILKHHTSFVLSPPPSASSSGSSFASGSGSGSSLPSLSSSSSRSSFLSTHSGSASGDIPSINLGPRSSSSSSLRSLPSRSQSQTQLRSRSRLSIVSNASSELIKEEESPPDLPPSPSKRRLSQAQTRNAGATQTQAITPTLESWYTFSPYATTPRFSRLGLAGSGVVMPVPKRELERVLSKRASVVGPPGGADGRNREKEGGAGLSRANTSASTKSTSSRMSISSTTSRMSMSSRMSMTSRMSRSGSPPPPIPPIPASVNAPAPIPAQAQAATGWQEHLGIPSILPRSCARSGTTKAVMGKSTQPSNSSTNSSPSSSSSSVQSTSGGRNGESTSASSVSLSNADVKGEVVVEVDVEGEKDAGVTLDDTNLDADAKDVGENDASPNIDEYKKGHKKNRKSFSESFSGSLRSWRSLRSLRSSSAAHDVPVPVPALPTSVDLSSSAVSGSGSVPDLHEVVVRQTPSPALAAGISTAVHASNPDVSAMQPGTQATIAPKPTLKKRKSASALLARVKSWRKKREENDSMGADKAEDVDALKNAGAVKDEDANGAGLLGTQASLVVVAAASDDVNENIADPAKGEGGVLIEPSLGGGDRPEGVDVQEVKAEEEDRDQEQSAAPAVTIYIVGVDDESDVDVDEAVVLIHGDAQAAQAYPERPNEESSKTAVEGDSDSSSSSCDSEYPASTPTSTPSSIHSLPSFVPMCIPIPSPNLHVSSSVSSPSSLPAAVPAFVRTQLLSLSAEARDVGDDVIQSLNPPIPEPPSSESLQIPIVESSLISGPGLSSGSRTIVVDQEPSVVDVDVDADEYADAEEFADDEEKEKEEEEEEEGVLTNRNVTETEVVVTPTVVVSHSDRGFSDDVHVIIVPSNDDEDGDNDIADNKEDDTNDTPIFNNPRSLTPPTSDSEDPASPPSITTDVEFTHPESSNPMPVPSSTNTRSSEPAISPVSPMDMPSSNTNTTTSPNPITNPSSLSLASTTKNRGRSQSRGKNKSRSGSVRRIWNAFICGASQAEQMAVEEAWAEIREREQQEGITQAGHEKKKEKSTLATVTVVDVEPNHDTPEVVPPVPASVVVMA